jgi:hypothetical protein
VREPINVAYVWHNCDGEETRFNPRAELYSYISDGMNESRVVGGCLSGGIVLREVVVCCNGWRRQ